MKIFEIEEVKDFMNALLVQDKYDSFYLYEARVKTKLDYYVNGKLNTEFFDSDDEEKENLEEYILWKDVKSTIFDFIKGKRLPLSFKIILMFNRENVLRLLEMNNVPLRQEDVGALFFNVTYDHGKLAVTTGNSIKVFTMDKTLENLWDDTVEKYYI